LRAIVETTQMGKYKESKDLGQFAAACIRQRANPYPIGSTKVTDDVSKKFYSSCREDLGVWIHIPWLESPRASDRENP
jgi:hypothetical protein